MGGFVIITFEELEISKRPLNHLINNHAGFNDNNINHAELRSEKLRNTHLGRFLQGSLHYSVTFLRSSESFTQQNLQVSGLPPNALQIIFVWG